MTPDDLAAVARALYGNNPNAIRTLADDLGVSYGNLRDVLRGRSNWPLDPAWPPKVLALVERRAVELGELAEKLRRIAR